MNKKQKQKAVKKIPLFCYMQEKATTQKARQKQRKKTRTKKL